MGWFPATVLVSTILVPCAAEEISATILDLDRTTAGGPTEAVDSALSACLTCTARAVTLPRVILPPEWSAITRSPMQWVQVVRSSLCRRVKRSRGGVSRAMRISMRWVGPVVES